MILESFFDMNFERIITDMIFDISFLLVFEQTLQYYKLFS